MICGAADEGSAALFVCGGENGSGSGTVAPAAQTGAVASAGG